MRSRNPQSDRPKPHDPLVDDALPLDDVGEDPVPRTVPPVTTERDDDEGGATPLDPDTGLPYDDSDPGTATVPADRTGGASDD